MLYCKACKTETTKARSFFFLHAPGPRPLIINNYYLSFCLAAPPFEMFIFKDCIILTLVTLSFTHRLNNPAPSLPRARSTPIVADPTVDCAVKELAWEFARKLQPQRGNFTEVYDALQLLNCNTSLNQPTPKPFRNLFSTRNPQRIMESQDTITFFVDVSKGNDSNPGSIDKPVKTMKQAVLMWRRQKSPGSSGHIYVREGIYFFKETLQLGAIDNFLHISSYQNENVIFSGGVEYLLSWKTYKNEMSQISKGINAIYDTGVQPGQNNNLAKYYGKVNSPEECQAACKKDSTCFVFTYHDSSVPDGYAGMCYFRVDGFWITSPETGHYSGRKINIQMADLSSQSPPLNFTTLFINNKRAVRARYPDGNPERMGLHTTPTGYVSNAEGWLPPKTYPPATNINIETPVRNGTHFPDFNLGIGGTVFNFKPPESYWGTTSPRGGGGSTYRITQGLQYSENEDFNNRTWKNPSTGVVHTFHCGHWGNWQFAVKSRDMTKRQIMWDYGGFQEARGCDRGAEWYVENVFEELDAPNEWFLDFNNRTLYYMFNTSAVSSGIAANLNTVISIIGSQDVPVQNITISGVTFSHTASTFLESYEVPSGGDWGIHRGGTLFIEGTVNTLVSNCTFNAVGGNGVFISNYNRGTIIQGNDFKYTGDSAIAAVGSSELIDGTGGNQPRGTQIIGNLAHEIGIWGKQTSFYFQSLACETELVGNVFFNGPRAGINFNDGFGGKNLVRYNLGFNMVRETGDHGPFNSWDRQPYLTNVNTELSQPSLQPNQSSLTRNFLINNYHSTWPIDHDDGSCYYYDTFNYLVYGGYKNYLGHSKIVKYNVYVYPDASHDLVEAASSVKKVEGFFSKPFCANSDGASTGDLPSGWGEVWSNNTCIIGNPNVYEFGNCDPDNLNQLVPETANNTFYAPNHSIYISCKGQKWTLQEYQQKGYDIGSAVKDIVDVKTVVQWGRDLLFEDH